MIIGHVTSTAITGGDSPVFEKAGLDVVLAAVENKDSAVEKLLAAQDAKIATLTDALTAFLAAQTPAVPVAPVEVELTPAEKAAATKAANKAKAEADAAEAK